MIKYRTLKTREDLLKAKELCDKHKIPFPNRAEAIFGAFDEDKIIGVTSLQKVYQIEPLINDSIHGMVSLVLLEKAAALASVHTNIVSGITKNESLINIYKRLGATIEAENVTYLSKEV